MFPYLDMSYVREGDVVVVDLDDQRRTLRVERAGLRPVGVDPATEEVVDMSRARVRSINGFGPKDVNKTDEAV